MSSPEQLSANKFSPLDKLCRTAVICLSILIVCYLSMSLVETVGGLMFPTFSDPNAEISSGREMALGLGLFGLAIVSVPVYVTCIVVICRFMYRANQNLRSAGRKDLEFTPGWCVGWWFIPIACLFKPREAMVELYKASDSSPDSEWQQNSFDPIINKWWAAWILGSIITRIESRMAVSGVDTGLAAIPITWTSTILLSLAAVWLISIVRHIAEQQRRNLSDVVHKGDVV